MKKVFMYLVISLITLTASLSHSLEFSPSLDLGIGLQHYEKENDDNEDFLYLGVKSYLFQQPGSLFAFRLVGAGLGVNTRGDAQVILSPVSVTLLSILTVAPDYGIGINDSPNYWGLSIGIGF